VGDIKRLGLEAEALPEIYWPYPQERFYPADISLIVRTAGNSLDWVATARQQINELVGGETPNSYVMTLEPRLAETVAPRRFQMFLFGVFAVVALALAVVGVYGVIAYSVSRRTHEIGIRMALGARPRDVLLMVVKHGMTLSLVGVLIGLGVALAVTRVMKGLLFELSVTDPPTFMLIAALMLGVTILACYLPARRATKVDPMTALRSE